MSGSAAPNLVKQAKRAWAQDLFDRTTITDATLRAGSDDGSSYSAGDRPAEVAIAEVGEDGELSDYKAMVFGQFPFSGGETTRAKPTVDIQNATPADVPAGTQFAFGGRRVGSTEQSKSVGYLNEDDYHAVSKELRDPIEPNRPFIVDGQLGTILARNAQTGFTPSFGDSSFSVKVMVWDGTGL